MISTTAQDTYPTQENGEWGVSFYSAQPVNAGLYWISPEGKHLDEIISYARLQTSLVGFATPFGLSPDGKTLAIAGGEVPTTSGATGTYLFDIATTHTMRIAVYNRELQYGHVWSPDGKLIVYCTITADPGIRRIEFINVETQKSQVVIPNSLSFKWGTRQVGTLDCARWLPNENRLVFSALVTLSSITSYHAIFAVNIDGSDLQQLTPDNIDVRLPQSAGNFVVNTPDGDQVYFLCTPADDLFLAHQICRINLATSAIEQVVDLTEFGITFQRTITPGIPDAVGEAQTVDMTAFTGQIMTRFAVSPDGKIALQLSDMQIFKNTIYLFNPVTNQLTYLTDGTNPEWFYR